MSTRKRPTGMLMLLFILPLSSVVFGACLWYLATNFYDPLAQPVDTLSKTSWRAQP